MGKRKRRHDEADLQVRLVRDLELLLPKDCFVFAVPNGGSRNKIEASNLKKQGVKAGVPDLIFIYRGNAFGLELKAPKGRVSDSQIITFPLLANAGMPISVARSHLEAIKDIQEFGIPLKLKPEALKRAA